jgi:hypothetical protein
MKRCEKEWTPVRAAGLQALVRELCGFCPCENGIPCPLFAPKVRHNFPDPAPDSNPPRVELTGERA